MQVNFPLLAQSGSHQINLFLVPESFTKRRMRFPRHNCQGSLLVLEEMSLGWICCSGAESTSVMAKAPRSSKDGRLLPRPSLDHPIDLGEAQPCCWWLGLYWGTVSVLTNLWWKFLLCAWVARLDSQVLPTYKRRVCILDEEWACFYSPFSSSLPTWDIDLLVGQRFQLFACS